MRAQKCERCGKFRKSSDVLYVDHGNSHLYEEVMECRWCMSPADQRRFNMPTKEPQP